MRMVLVIGGIVALAFLTGCQTEPEQREEAAVELQVETGFAEVEGARLYYEIAGTGDPLVLIQTDGRVWEGQFETFAPTFNSRGPYTMLRGCVSSSDSSQAWAHSSQIFRPSPSQA